MVMSVELNINNTVQTTSSFPYVVLEGYSFTWTTGVYLSAITNSEIFSSLKLVYIDDFINVRSVSASCPPISAYEVSSYGVSGDNFMVVEVPKIGTGQLEAFHVIVKNRAGYTFTSLFSSNPPPLPPPTQSNTPTPSVTQTPYRTPSQTPTLTQTPTRTVPLPTPTNTRTPLATQTPTNSIGASPTPTKTIPVTPSPTATSNVIYDCGITLSGFVEDQNTYRTFRVRTIQPWGTLQTIEYDAVSEPELYLMTLSGKVLGSSGFVGDPYYNDLMIKLGYGPLSGGPIGSFDYVTPLYPIYAPETETFILSVFSPLKNSKFYAKPICPSPTPSAQLIQIIDGKPSTGVLPQSYNYHRAQIPCDLAKFGGQIQTSVSTFELPDTVILRYIPYVGASSVILDTGCLQTKPFTPPTAPNVPVVSSFNWPAGQDGIFEYEVYTNCNDSSVMPVGYTVKLFYIPNYNNEPVSITCTPVPTLTPTRTPAPTVTPTKTITPTPTLSLGATPSVTPTNTITPSFTPTKTVTPTNTPTTTKTPTPTQTLLPLFNMRPDVLISLSGQQLTILSSYNLTSDLVKRGGVLRTHITTFQIPEDVSIYFYPYVGTPELLAAPGCIRTEYPPDPNVPVLSDFAWPQGKDGTIVVSVYTNCNGSPGAVGYSVKAFEFPNYSVTPIAATNTPTHTPTATPTLSIGATPSRTPTHTPTPTSTTPSACLNNWSLVNFSGTTFRNGDAIPQITDQEEWNAATGPGWCYYDNDPTNGAIYGKLYNRYAVTDVRGLAPEGYHVPSLAEWQDLIICLGGSDAGGGIWPVAGAKMKTTGTFQDGNGLWNTPNVATNESGFSVVPAGCRTSGFINLHSRGSFWVNDSDTCINFNNGASYVYIGGDSTIVGYSLRLKQGEIPIPTPTMTLSPTNTPSGTSTSISSPYAYEIEYRISDGSNNISGWLNQQEACQGSNNNLTVYSDSSTFVEGMQFYSNTSGGDITNVVAWTDYYYYYPSENKVFRWLDGDIAGTITSCNGL